MLTFQELIKKIRESSGLTQKQFAERLSVSPILIAMIESGQKEVSKNFIIRLSNSLGIHPSSITPFLFMEKDLNTKELSFIEKSLIDFGEKMQEYLITKKAKKLLQND
jgi:transcriptional regulator with XRE-family HTH domain